jgi:hypothetical protein
MPRVRISEGGTGIAADRQRPATGTYYLEFGWGSNVGLAMSVFGVAQAGVAADGLGTVGLGFILIPFLGVNLAANHVGPGRTWVDHDSFV